MKKAPLLVAALSVCAIGLFVSAQTVGPTTTPAASSGVKIEELPRIDLDCKAQGGDVVTVLYTGKLADGTVFDSSFSNPEMPRAIVVTIGQNRVIQGWEQGLVGMRLGDSRRLTIPPELAYGDKGSPPAIPPNATLTFDVTVVKIEKKS
jgi:FKBP-type peptidyl-prolyl cis-trans isomerase